MDKLCHCGKPLHYTDPEIQRAVEKLIEQLGETVKVTLMDDGRERTWRVPRHYIALHGLKGREVAGLGFEEICPNG